MQKLTEKQALFSKLMFTIGTQTFSNGVKSARKAGYKGSYGTLNQVARENLQKPLIIAEKQRIQAKTAKKVEKNRDYCIARAVDILEHSDNERNRLTALSLLADFIGAKRDNAPNAEREQAKLARMDDETKRVAQQLALLLTRKRVISVSEPCLEAGKGE